VNQDYTSVKNIYIICGKTDMRKGIDELPTLIQDSYELDPEAWGRTLCFFLDLQKLWI